MRSRINQAEQVFAPRFQLRAILKHVREARAKHSLSFTASRGLGVPFQGLSPVALCCFTALCAIAPLHDPGALGPRFCIAMSTRWTYLRATKPRIKRVVRPLDL